MTKFHLVHDVTPRAREMAQHISADLPLVPRHEADTIISLGGDGFMLKTLHRFLGDHVRFYGVNCGRIGFLMNTRHKDGLAERIARARETILYPLKAMIHRENGDCVELLAINEVYLLRASHQAAKIKTLIDGVVRLPEMASDGVILATPAGSTAYNLSAHGPIVPIGANLLALTPINAFRPRRWRGALLPSHVKVEWIVNESKKRPVTAVADFHEITNVASIQIVEDRSTPIHLLFDPEHHLEERIINEQFIV